MKRLFTIIAILAAISIVAYNGINDRAQYTKALSDLQQINKALQAYNAEHGNYPIYTAWRYYCNYQSNPANFIPTLSEISPTIPAAPCTGESTSDDTWLYRSSADGLEYKLLYLRANVSDGFRNQIPTSMRDPTRWSAGTSWGYWTSGFANT